MTAINATKARENIYKLIADNCLREDEADW